MQETTITNAITLGVSTSIESLNDSSSDVYLNCGGDYYKGSVVSGFKKELTTVNVEGVFIDVNNTAGALPALRALSALGQEGEKTTLTVQTIDGGTASFGEGEIKSLSLEPGPQVNEATYSLSFETEETALTKGKNKNEYLLLDPARYESIDEDFNFSHELKEDSWTITHNLSVVPNDQGDFTTKKAEEKAAGAKGAGVVALELVQIAQAYIQEAMLEFTPPFPLGASIGTILGNSCDPSSYSDSCSHRIDYSYSSSIDLVCGGVSTTKTLDITESGIADGYTHTYDVEFTRDDEGVVTMVLNGQIDATKQDVTENGGIIKSFYQYAAEGYTIEKGKAKARIQEIFDEFDTSDDEALNDKFSSTSKTVTNQDKEGNISYTLEMNNSAEDEDKTTVSKNTSVEENKEEVCEGSQILVTTIVQSVSVEGNCGKNVTPAGGYPRFESTAEKYNELYAAAAGEIEALYNGERDGYFRKTNTSTKKSRYKGTRGYTITYSDAPVTPGGGGYPNTEGCYSWKVDAEEIPAWPREVEAQSVEGPYIETKGESVGQKSIEVYLQQGTGVCAGDVLTTFLTKTKGLINDENTDSCFISSVGWSSSVSLTKPAQLQASTTFIQN